MTTDYFDHDQYSKLESFDCNLYSLIVFLLIGLLCAKSAVRNVSKDFVKYPKTLELRSYFLTLQNRLRSITY